MLVSKSILKALVKMSDLLKASADSICIFR